MLELDCPGFECRKQPALLTVAIGAGKSKVGETNVAGKSKVGESNARGNLKAYLIALSWTRRTENISRKSLNNRSISTTL